MIRACFLLGFCLATWGCSTSPSSAEACRPTASSWVTARDLVPGAAPVTEKNSFPALSDSLSACEADHYYRFFGKDTGLGPGQENEPHVTLSSADFAPLAKSLKMCVYVLCDAGATALADCGDGATSLVAPTTSRNGFAGCCRTGPGYLEPHYSCNTSVTPATSVDTALIYVHVCSTGALDTPVSYEITGGF